MLWMSFFLMWAGMILQLQAIEFVLTILITYIANQVLMVSFPILDLEVFCSYMYMGIFDSNILRLLQQQKKKNEIKQKLHFLVLGLLDMYDSSNNFSPSIFIPGLDYFISWTSYVV